MSIRRNAAVILTAGAIAASVLAASPAQGSVRVDWDDPLTTKVEKAPKTKISQGEYKRLHKGQSYAKVTADGARQGSIHRPVRRGRLLRLGRPLVPVPVPGRQDEVVRRVGT